MMLEFTVQLYYLLGLFFLLWPEAARGNPDAKRLYDDLLRKSGYNKLIRPVGNNTDKLTVKLGLRLSQLIDVDEKNQIMTTNVWLAQEWVDNTLKWNPSEYGGVTTLMIPSQMVWVPDIVLYNSADERQDVTTATKASVSYDGRVNWKPPAIIKSQCQLNMEFFPFDEQMCTMKFGSLEYNGFQVDLKHLQSDKLGVDDLDVIEHGIDLTDFYRSSEWDLLSVPAKKNEKYHTCCSEPYYDIAFNVTIERKTLYYTVNMIIPSVTMSFLTVLVFYLPPESGQKITLCIFILLSSVMFSLYLSQIIPPTSLVIPLISKYLLFNMILTVLVLIITVLVLNVHFRSPSTHPMSRWVKILFLNVLPKLLLMKKPQTDQTCNGIEIKNTSEETRETMISQSGSVEHKTPGNGNLGCNPEIASAIDDVKTIAKHVNEGDTANKMREDWRYVARVLDRLFLWIFTITCIVGVLSIMLQAPGLYDNRRPL